VFLVKTWSHKKNVCVSQQSFADGGGMSSARKLSPAYNCRAFLGGLGPRIRHQALIERLFKSCPQCFIVSFFRTESPWPSKESARVNPDAYRIISIPPRRKEQTGWFPAIGKDWNYQASARGGCHEGFKNSSSRGFELGKEDGAQNILCRREGTRSKFRFRSKQREAR